MRDGVNVPNGKSVWHQPNLYLGEVGKTNLFSANVTLRMHWLVLSVKRLNGILRLLNKGMAKKYHRDVPPGGILFVTGSIP